MIPDQPTNPHFKKTGILRSGALSDMLVALPAVWALHKKFPETEIVLMTDPFTPAYTNKKRFPIDNVLSLPPIKGITPGGVKEWYDYADLTIRIENEQFDVLLHFQGKGITATPFPEACKPQKIIRYKTRPSCSHH